MNKKLIYDKLKDKEEYLKKTFHVKKIGVFGSFARDEQNCNSDIDILVEFEKGYKDLFNYMKLKYYLEELFNRKVDLVIKNAIKKEIKEKILNEVKYA